MKGTTKTNEGYICVACNTVVSNLVDTIPNFCPNCATPLKVEAVIKERTKLKEVGLEVVEMFENYKNSGFSFEESL